MLECCTRLASACRQLKKVQHQAKQVPACCVQECAERIFQEVGGNQWSSLQALRDCIGDIDANVNNPIFEAEMARQRGDDETGEVRFTCLCLVRM